MERREYFCILYEVTVYAFTDFFDYLDSLASVVVNYSALACIISVFNYAMYLC
jgi:hypothetical protein